MSKRKIDHEIIDGMNKAIDYVRGKKTRTITHRIEIPDNIDVRKIRKKLNLTRNKFAEKFGFSARTLQHWEQGDRQPHGPAKILLLILQSEPTVVERVLMCYLVKKRREHK